MSRSTDVVILGAGLAGLTLARQLLLETDRRVVLLDRRAVVPGDRQKVGESTVQVAGYYLSRVLDLEEHLLTRHFMKYNLRFYWPSRDRSNAGFEDYSQSYIREISNVASYQVDRNELERELLRLNQLDDRFTFVGGAKRIEVELNDDASHGVTYRAGETCRSLISEWVVDATGRGRALAKNRGLMRESAIRHGSFFWWVDGLIDIEKLTERSAREVRLDPRRSARGHLPTWLATNHFLGEGFWFWVIPLHGKTSLGLVYDRDLVAQEEVFSVEKATRWVCEQFPLFELELAGRTVLDRGGYKSFSHDCVQTIHPSRWAITGEAGRFSDPLYSPGSDLIAIYNTLIVDAIRTEDRSELERKCARHEALMEALFEAYEPSYALTYDALGDPETFGLKYIWELTVYFGFYVFPFVNDLWTDRNFQVPFLRAFARLGSLNRSIQRLLSGYFQWKKHNNLVGLASPVDFDFASVGPLRSAAGTFFRIGISTGEARRVLTSQLENLEELARFVAASVAAGVTGNPEVLSHAGFVAGLDLEQLDFDEHEIRERWEAVRADAGEWTWSFDPRAMQAYRDQLGEVVIPTAVGSGSAR